MNIKFNKNLMIISFVAFFTSINDSKEITNTVKRFLQIVADV
jgi:hypothetical protein